MSTHTAGEWGVATINNGHADDEIVTIVNGCMVNIAAVFGQGEYSEARPDGKDDPHYTVSREESAANARLISAAPEMLDALRIAEAFVAKFEEDQDYTDGQVETINAIRDAIAKATGGGT